MHELADQILSHLKAIWHYRWLALISAWIIASGGWVYVYRMPDRYEASARVWVDTQAIVKNLLAGLTVQQPNAVQTVSMISRTLISRPNMEKVIRMADMDVGLKTSEDRERLITRLTKEVTIQSAGGDIYTIAYTDTDAQKAKQVVQSLLTIFEEGSRNNQKKNSEAAQRFIEGELKTSKEKLDAAEKAVIEFKRRQSLMAGGRGDYTRLVDAQAALSEATLELKIAETSRDAIKKNLPDETEIPSLLGDNSANGSGPPESDTRIKALEEKLDGLRLNYTEQHPDIVAIVNALAQLKEQKNAQTKLRKPSRSEAQVPGTGYRPLTLSLATAEANVAAAKARVAEYSKRYDELKTAAIAAPQNDAEYAHLSRDYEMARATYGALLSRRETARISEEMETKTSATDFRVIDPPQVPFAPKAPNRQILNSIVLLMALGGGVGLAFVLSQIRPTFNDERRLKEVSGIQVLGTVIMAWTDAQNALRTRGLVALLISFASLLSAYAAIMMGLVLTASRV
jgi:polysaccharide chain length determinant protein (PEP-CTERM system associated)